MLEYFLDQNDKHGKKHMELVKITAQELKEWNSFSKKLYDAFPYPDLLMEIAQARKEYYAKYKNK